MFLFLICTWQQKEKKEWYSFYSTGRTQIKVIKAPILDSSHGLQWLEQPSKPLPQVIFGMLILENP